MTGEKLLKLEEVALLVNSSAQTINNWYRWKKLHPEHELAELLPNYIQRGSRQTRYWTQNDIWAITEFKSRLPHGRHGILGDVTQKHTKFNKNFTKEIN